jgi:hypothetical protein
MQKSPWLRFTNNLDAVFVFSHKDDAVILDVNLALEQSHQFAPPI